MTDKTGKGKAGIYAVKREVSICNYTTDMTDPLYENRHYRTQHTPDTMCVSLLAYPMPKPNPNTKSNPRSNKVSVVCKDGGCAPWACHVVGESCKYCMYAVRPTVIKLISVYCSSDKNN